MIDAPAIGALAPWFGSKRTLARRIVVELGRHRVYWDFCAGSMAVPLEKEPCVMETIVDLHGHLTNLARVVQHPELGPKLYRRLRRVIFSEAQYNDLLPAVRDRYDSDDLDLDRAFAYFTCAWHGRNGVAGTANYNSGFCVRYTGSGGHAAKRWKSAVDSIPAWRRRMRNFTILRRDIFEVIPRVRDEEGTSIYVDPPYLRKGSKYLHDFTEADHARLAAALGRFRLARVVVSYYAEPELRELYPGWTWVDCTMTKSLVNCGMRDSGGPVKAPEVLLINGESYTEGGLYA